MTRHPNATDAPEPMEEGWTRLDARMLLIEPVREIARMAPALFGVAIAGTADAVPGWVAWVVLFGTVAVGALRWVATTYRITAEQVQLRTGLLQRATQTAPLDRVRTVDVTAAPMHRLLGVATVRIGTAASQAGIDLDGLAAPDAQRLREQLLHRSAAAGAPDAVVPGQEVAANPHAPRRRPERDELLATFRGEWLRYAPLTTSGFVALLAFAGFSVQFLEQIRVRLLDTALGRSTFDHLRGLAPASAFLEIALIAAVVVVGAAVASYVLRYWNFRLSRHPRGTLHVHRGLLTTRSTTLEERRLRGVVVVTPALVGLARGARLDALVTGLAAEDDLSGAGNVLLPACPRRLVDAIGETVLGDPGPIHAPLRAHGPAAHRRRHTRALVGGLLLAAPVSALVVVLSWHPWVHALAAVPVLAAPLLAEGRYRVLGHTVAGGHLVAQAGLFPRERSIVRLDAVIGWILDASFFQRRAGLLSLRAMTATPSGSVDVLDITPEEAIRVVEAATPGLLAGFRAGDGAVAVAVADGRPAAAPPDAGATARVGRPRPAQIQDWNQIRDCQPGNGMTSAT